MDIELNRFQTLMTSQLDATDHAIGSEDGSVRYRQRRVAFSRARTRRRMQSTQSTDGTEVTYERHGDGRSLILLHGRMAPREYWNPVVPHFKEYATVVPQRPGFGTCLDSPGETDADGVLERETNYVRTLIEADVASGSGRPRNLSIWEREQGRRLLPLNRASKK